PPSRDRRHLAPACTPPQPRSDRAPACTRAGREGPLCSSVPPCSAPGGQSPLNAAASVRGRTPLIILDVAGSATPAGGRAGCRADDEGPDSHPRATSAAAHDISNVDAATARGSRGTARGCGGTRGHCAKSTRMDGKALDGGSSSSSTKGSPERADRPHWGPPHLHEEA